MHTIPQVFEALGLSALEEVIYVTLIDTPSSSLRELSDLLHTPTGQIQRGLALLHEKGLVTERATRPRRYSPAAPEAAMEVLALKRQEEIHEARLAASQLAERHRVATESTRTNELLEVLTSSRAISQRFRQLQQSAREEVIGVDRPPYTAPGLDEVKAEKQMLDRDVKVRFIYTREALEVPDKLSRIRELMAAGEEARVLTEVPQKLVIIDRSVGLMPLSFEARGVEDAVVVHASFLLRALSLLFESLWEKATPLGPSTEESETEADSPDELLRLLASGLKDESIARILGWSRSTVTRKMRELTEELGAKTRFQLALLADRKYRFYEGGEEPPT